MPLKPHRNPANPEILLCLAPLLPKKGAKPERDDSQGLAMCIGEIVETLHTFG